MLKDVLQLWLQALRSGDYKINKFRLTNGGRYSPMGVLANVLIKEYGEGKWYNLDDKFDDQPIVFNKGYAWVYRPDQVEQDERTEERRIVKSEIAYKYRVYLPNGQWFWPGLTTKIQDTIYSWTDSHGYSMYEVANAVEDGKHLE